jgi:hypothetical protein
MHHTIYCGDPSAPKSDSGHSTRLLRAEFFAGRRKSELVPETEKAVLSDLGYVQTTRPDYDTA